MNKLMVCVDLLNSLTVLYKYNMKSRHLYILYHTVIFAITNSWLWYKCHTKLMPPPPPPPPKKKPMKLRIFQGMIAKALPSVKKVGRPSSCSVTPTAAKIIHEKAPVADVCLNGCGHLPKYTPDHQCCKFRDCQALTASSGTVEH